MKRRPWTRDELLSTLSLYCQTPFGRMHSSNPAVTALAQQIDRTPSAVALKLVNFASLDPELQSRGVRGMSNASAADREVWSEFYGRWDILADQLAVEEESSNEEPAQSSRSSLINSQDTEIRTEGTRRRGQAFFRASVLAAHDGKCCITGISERSLLRASHIVPWSKDESRRLDPHNGLCLNVLHDAAFDRGFITLNGRFELQVSERLAATIPDSVFKELFESRAGLPISMPERFSPCEQALDLHRTSVFQP